jgi:diguanylate cyclase (GGDEF)-like protein
LFLRFDVSAVREELKLYIFNTFFLTLFVTLIVIAGCLIALRPFLFNPITTLGSLMRRVDRTGLAAVYIPNRMLLKRDEIGDTFRAFSRMRDALLKADEENQQITARFQGMADLAADCFFETDENRRFSFVAGDTFSVFGLRPSKMVGKTFADLVAQGRLPFAKPQEVVASLQEKGTWEGQLVSSDRHVEGRTVKMISTPLFDRDGNRVGMRGVLTDTTLAAKLTRELVHRAAHDGLTGLYNRTEFSRRLVGCLEQIRVDQGKACVFVMDLDRFKYVNDRCGHLAGDEVLRRVSEILRSSVRASDAVARMGGDEFAILLERCNSQNGLRVAEKIREAIDRMRFEWDGVVHSVGVSIGIVEVDETYTDVDAVILAADSSCFVSKRQGRNQVSVYSPSDDTVKERSEDMQWINLIERALKEDRCILFQQPIMPLKQAGTKKVHFEVLLRLLDESGEIVPPGAFLPCAERNGLIDGIDRQVVRKVLKWLAVQKAEPSTDLTVSMNLSGASIADANFQEFLLTSISEAPVSAHHLCFEITESAAVQNLVSSGEFLSRVRALGCRIALDDFGTGFASLEYIKQLPLDFIKIDGAFIREIANNPLDQALVRCVSDVAHLLDVETVAEFVENDETIHELNRLGIDFAQGFLIAKPKPLGDLSTLFPAAQADLTE